MFPRLQLSNTRVLLLWALITAAMFAVLNLLIVHINVEPPEPFGQILLSVATFFAYNVVYCSVVALVIGLLLVALTRTRMQTGPLVATIHGAILGSASVAVGMLVFFFSGTVRSVLIILVLGAACGACAALVVGRAAVRSP
jgi:hypothetical protein